MYKRNNYFILVRPIFSFARLALIAAVCLLLNVCLILAQKPELVVQIGHTTSADTIVFSPDGKTLASGASDQTIKLRSIETGLEVRSLIGHTGNVNSVAFSPDGITLASGSSDETVKLWNVETGKEIKSLTNHTGFVKSVAFSPSGKFLASGSDDKTIKLWNIETGIELKSLTGHKEYVQSVTFSPDGKTLISGSNDKTIKLWNIETGLEIKSLTGHDGGINLITLSPDGETLASGSDDKTIKLWNVKTGREISSWKAHIDDVIALAFSPDGKTLASGGVIDTKLIIWNVETGKEVKTFTRNNRFVNSVAFSPDGKTLASAVLGEINLWNVETEQEVKSFTSHANSITSVAFSPDNKFIASVGYRIITLWNLEAGQEVKFLTEPNHDIESISFSPSGKTLASGSYKTITLWDVETGNDFTPLTDYGNSPDSMAFSSDGKILAFSGGLDKTVKLWNRELGEDVKSLSGHTSYIKSIAFSPDSKILATGSLDHTIKLWDVGTGQQIKSLKNHKYKVNTVAFSPDGKTLGSGSDDKTIKLWNVETGQEIKSFTNHTGDVNSLAFSPDGKTLISGSYDKTIKLWNVETGQEIKNIVWHTGQVTSVAFSPDGKFFISGSTDATVNLWMTEGNQPLATLVSFYDYGWVVTTPDGRFDAENIDKVDGLAWVLPDQPLTPRPLEIFLRQYYEPKLLQRVLKCNEENNCDKEFKPLPSIADINRVQPKVAIKEIKPSANTADLVDVTIEVESVSEEFKLNPPEETRKKRLSSGGYDLRLFRDGQLVGVSTPKDKLESFIKSAPDLIEKNKKYIADTGKLINTPEDIAWRETNDIFQLKSESLKTISPGKVQYTFRNIKLPHDGSKEVEFTAYAFNSDKVKSTTTTPVKFTIPSAVSSVPKKGRAYLISIGVNASQKAEFNLRFAANDARKMQEIVGARLTAENAKFSAVVSIPLISDHDANGKMTEDTANKAIIKGVFALLAGDEKEVSPEVLAKIPNRDKIKAVEPEDTLIITYAGHGYADRNGIFYLIPYDVGANSENLATVLNKSISSDELSLWMQNITAQEMIFIVDACNSAAAVQGTNFKPGPMGSRGLGQLAYDKDMRILAATQADNVALELNKLQQGLLSYALLQNGIIEKKADTEADFNQLSAKEWLSYGVKRVPEIYEEVKAGKRTIMFEGNAATVEQSRQLIQPKQKSAVNLQQPTLFDFSRRKVNKSLLPLP